MYLPSSKVIAQRIKAYGNPYDTINFVMKNLSGEDCTAFTNLCFGL